MTKKELFERLLKLAQMPGSARDPWIVADMVNQENLFEIQVALLEILNDLGTDLKQGHRLVDKMPYAFREVSQ